MAKVGAGNWELLARASPLLCRLTVFQREKFIYPTSDSSHQPPAHNLVPARPACSVLSTQPPGGARDYSSLSNPAL
jgi:hypothetical protein